MGVAATLLLAANIINLGADLGAMGEALRLLIGGPPHLYVVIFSVGCALLEIFVRYERYVSILKWTSVSLFAYVATALVVDVPWARVAYDLVVPTLSRDKDYIVAIVAVLGTTITPYCFFWQSSQEAEDERVDPAAHALIDRIDVLPFTTIALVHGQCLGGGLELALACDYRIARSDAMFAFPEVRVGLHPGLGGAARLMAMIPSLFAILVMFLVMRLTGMMLNIATILIASTVLGTSENDQIHFFYHFLERRRDGTVEQALAHTLMIAGRAIFFATIINAGGFLAFAGGELPPIRQFGVLAALAFVLSMVADFTALPAALWILLRERPDQRPAADG